MLNIKNIELKLQLEKMVIGLEEPILIKGAGKFNAKVDSGNGGYNVIHGEDFVRQGDILNFKTIDAEGNERRISKKIADTLNVHIGGGNIQERPVVELDIKFADEDYKKVPFSVTDRSNNKEKVLISKDFVKDQLDALIDVSKTNMTEEEPVEVDYVNEGLLDVIKHPIKASKSLVNNTTSFLDKIANGTDRFENTYYNKTPKKDKNNSKNKSNSSTEEKVSKDIVEVQNLVKDVDPGIIRSKLANEKNKINPIVFSGQDIKSESCENFEIVRILDYTNHIMYGDVLYINSSTLNKDSYIIKLIKKYDNILFENSPPITDTTTVSTTPSATQTQDSTTSETGNNDAAPSSQETNAKSQEIKNKQKFCLYFCGRRVGNDVNNLEALFESVDVSYKNYCKNFLNAGNYNENAFIRLVNNLRDTLNKTNLYKQGYCGVFALCIGEPAGRKCILFAKKDNILNLFVEK